MRAHQKEISPVKASIIIVTKNQKSLLQKTIPTLLKQKYNEPYEIIVVDSGSIDGAVEYVKTKPVKLIQIPAETFNYANAFNTGAKKAKGTFLVRLSGDCIPQGNTWLSHMIAGFTDKTVGGVYGKYVISNTPGLGYPDYWPASRFPKKVTRHTITPVFGSGLNFMNISIQPSVFQFAGGCCAVRKAIWNARPFNEWLQSGEDAEYAWFLHLTGWDIVYRPGAKCLHEHTIDLVKSARAYSGFNKNNLMFMWNILTYWMKRMVGYDAFNNYYREKIVT